MHHRTYNWCSYRIPRTSHCNRLLSCTLRQRRDHENCCGGKSLTRLTTSHRAIGFDAYRVTQSASSRLKPTAFAATTDMKRRRRHEITRKGLGRFGRFRRFKFEVRVREWNFQFLVSGLSPFPIPHIFVFFRDGSKSRFVSAASDDTRKGETEMDAPPRHSLRVRADCDVSIAQLRDSSPPQFSWSRQRRNATEYQILEKMSESMPADYGATCFTNSIMSAWSASSSAFWRSVSATVSSLYPSPQPNVPPSVTSRCRYCRETSERHNPSFLSM